jgi:hypothetical protein
MDLSTGAFDKCNENYRVKEMTSLKSNMPAIAVNLLLIGGFFLIMFLTLSGSWWLFIALFVWTVLFGLLFGRSGGSMPSLPARGNPR